MNNPQVFIFGFILFILILMAAFFSLAETGLMAVNRYRLRHKARLKQRYAIRLIDLLKRPDRVLGAILIGSTFANVLASTLATLIAFHYWGDQGAFLVAFVLTFVILIFAEITPKTLAALYPDEIARWVSYPIYIILKAFLPLVWFANAITNGLLTLVRIRVAPKISDPISKEELRAIVYETSGKISRQYQKMLLSVLDLSKLNVEDVMIPRHEIKGIDLAQPWQKIIETLQSMHQDAIPVYRNHTNQMVGILYTHELFKNFLNQREINEAVIEETLQKPYFVPVGTSLTVQLAHFQRTHDKMAFVVDEYGEIEGLLTLNDILEEIVGEITPTIATARLYKQIDGSYLVNGSLSVREFNRLTDWELPLGVARTVNGLIVDHLQSLPHEKTGVLIAEYPIEIIEVKDNRVKIARVYPHR